MKNKTTREIKRALEKENRKAFSEYMQICNQFYKDLFDDAFESVSYGSLYDRYSKRWFHIADALNKKLSFGKVDPYLFSKEYKPAV